MKKKIAKNFIYTGLGFPIKLCNVELIEFEGEFHPKIDVRKTAEAAIKALVSEKSRLTGNQIKFIRTYFSMSLRDFAKVVNESHTAVRKWEDFGDNPTNMDKNIEIMLRLYIYDKIIIKTKNQKSGFYDQYVKLKEAFSQKHQQFESVHLTVLLKNHNSKFSRASK